MVNCISFGFKFGVPVDADLMFDVRCLPNPFYDPNLHDDRSGEPVQQFVLDSQKTQGFLTRLYDFIDDYTCDSQLYRHDEKKSLLVWCRRLHWRKAPFGHHRTGAFPAPAPAGTAGHHQPQGY